MLFRTHILFALFIFLLININSKISLFALLACLFGAGLADLDEPRSKFGKEVKLISKTLKWLFKHRGAMHSLLGAIVIYVLVYCFLSLFGFNVELSVWLFIGYVSHLFADSLTPQGVAWLTPFSKKRLKWIIRTGKFGEKLFLYLIIIVIVLLASKIFQPFY